jgi:hypothetical protein
MSERRAPAGRGYSSRPVSHLLSGHLCAARKMGACLTSWIFEASSTLCQVGLVNRFRRDGPPLMRLTGFFSVPLYQTYLRRTGGICAPESARGRQTLLLDHLLVSSNN